MSDRQKKNLSFIIYILLLGALRFSDGFNCVKNFDPVCDIVYCSDTIQGNTLQCFINTTDSQSGQIPHAYVIDYKFHKRLKVECNSSAPYKPGMLKELDISEIDYFVFSGCSLPTVSFNDFLSGLTVRKLKFENRNGNLQLTASLFKGLALLKLLNLAKNKLSVLPEDVFQYLTNIESLHLSDNELQTLPENVFQPLNNLENLELGANKLSKLPAGLFRNLPRLKRIYLYRNKLSTLSKDIFDNLESLEILELFGNEFTKLPGDVFSGLLNLRSLGLSKNKLETLPSELFRKNLALEELDLSSNPTFRDLPGDLFTGLTNLKYLTINHCNLTNFSSSFFSEAPNLLQLKLHNNRLTSLPVGIFDNNRKLHILEMPYNDLTFLPIGLFDYQISLQKLNLYKNNIKSLSPDIFQNFVNIREINLGYNFLTELNNTLFRNTQSLETLILSGNQIISLAKVDLFGKPVKLKKLDLSNNNLTEFINMNWNLVTNLEELRLDNNQITFFKVPLIRSDDANVYLKGNQIKTVDMRDVYMQLNVMHLFSSKHSEGSSPVYYLQDNAFQCDCHLLDFADYLRNYLNDVYRIAIIHGAKNLPCIGPSHLANKAITSVPREKFICSVRNNCPDLCHCYFRTSDKAVIVNCSGLHWDTLPLHLPENTNILHLEKNNISSLNIFSSDAYRNLTEIYLDENHISSIDNWKLPPNLKMISLRKNYLTHISTDIYKEREETLHFDLRLGYNPWECTCETLELKSWLTNNLHKIKDIDDIYCSEPVKLNGTLRKELLVQMPDNILCPHATWPQKIKLISVSVICVVLAILLFVVSVLYYRNKQTVIAYVYIHLYNVFMCFFTEEELDEDKIFDAFISYSSSDRETAFSILKELETNEPLFKVCIHDRDWLAGNAISWNIVNSVQNSRRTILVISKDFLESVWFQIEFHTAYYQMLEDKVDRLIVVVKGELPPKDTFDKDLQYLLSTKTYLVWGEKWFWEKLRYAMPHHRSLRAPENKTPFRNRPPSAILKSVEEQIENYTLNGNKNKQNDILSQKNKNQVVTQSNFEPTALQIGPLKRNGDVFISSRV
ncbi:protein toll-like [Limulus polyphemus]|uniref:Protein toll-like n=1 Tax=Limulus polyphemus TaxID=6850 RepID=A0ABM1BGH2_LIMPO|nr:protein toll-like [Limulus polyphemus]XP_013781530.1 protein toll-like [Limulus polyphemus]XP_013781531.1 protein toll-like [Limulus polyphemus]XP_022249497.1 protein toll-like [Limulus polyphemus]